MASITIYLRKDHTPKDNLYPVCIKVRSGKLVKVIPTGWKIKETQWNDQEKVVIKHEDKAAINSKISEIVSEWRMKINDALLHNTPFDLTKDNKKSSYTFTDYLLLRADQYKALNQAEPEFKIRWIVKELNLKFGPLQFKDINTDMLRTYHAYLKTKNKPNTIHKRFSTLRQLFNNAVNEGVYIGANPFTLFKVNKVPVLKEKLSVEEIQAIEKVNLKGGAAVARDMFLLAYYCKGIRYENCVTLQRKNIRQGRIYIKTVKSERDLSILIHPKLQGILDRYKGKDFVFPYLETMPDEKDKRRVLGVINVTVNRDLKLVAAAAGIDKTLTFHLSRHAIAYHLKQSGVDVAAISDILGHSNPSITQVYLKALDDSALDSEMDKVYK